VSQSQQTRLERLEQARTDVSSQLVVRRAGEAVALFTVVVPYLEPATIDLEWPERNEAQSASIRLSEHQLEGKTSHD
jgi:hypothetical protein